MEPADANRTFFERLFATELDEWRAQSAKTPAARLELEWMRRRYREDHGADCQCAYHEAIDECIRASGGPLVTR